MKITEGVFWERMGSSRRREGGKRRKRVGVNIIEANYMCMKMS
jgi:hypothetical protein